MAGTRNENLEKTAEAEGKERRGMLFHTLRGGIKNTGDVNEKERRHEIPAKAVWVLARRVGKQEWREDRPREETFTGEKPSSRSLAQNKERERGEGESGEGYSKKRLPMFRE